MTYLTNFGIIETLLWALVFGICLAASFRFQYWLNILSREKSSYLAKHPSTGFILRILAFLLSFCVIAGMLVSAKRIRVLTLDIRLILILIIALIVWFIWGKFGPGDRKSKASSKNKAESGDIHV
jgi:hypothetical protein